MVKKSDFTKTQSLPDIDNALTFNTHDLGCSASLLCAGFELLSLDKSNPRRVMFSFSRKDNIESVVEDYWANRLEVKGRMLFENIKMLKNRIYSE